MIGEPDMRCWAFRKGFRGARVPRLCGLTAVLFLASAPGMATAESARSLVERGNAAYEDERYDEALSAYEKADVDMPESAELYFNKGCVLYRKHEYEKARESFGNAALKTRDLSLEARSKFNLGNCAFRQAERQKDSDPAKAIDYCGESVRYYQETLKLDPEFREAAENIEIVRLAAKKMLDELKQQEQQQQGQQEQQQEGQQEQQKQGQQEGQEGNEKGGQEQNKDGENREEQAAGYRQESGQENGKQDEQPVMRLNDDARDILDEEKDNRERRRVPVRGGYRDVDRDW